MTATAAETDKARTSHPQRWLILGVICLAQLTAALAAARDEGERQRIADAFASGLETSQLVGAVAVPAGGLLAAMPLRRAERADAPKVAA